VVVLSHKKMGLFTLSPVLAPFPKMHTKQHPNECPARPSPASRQKMNDGHPPSQLTENNGRVEQPEPKVFLNFIIRGVKVSCVMLAVVKINYSIVGKKG